MVLEARGKFSPKVKCKIEKNLQIMSSSNNYLTQTLNNQIPCLKSNVFRFANVYCTMVMITREGGKKSN